MTAAPDTGSPLDAHLWDGLSFAQRFTVWSLRLWLAGRMGDATAAEKARSAFEVAGAAEAANPLDRLMRSLASLSARPIRLAPVAATALSQDEALLLRALSVAQQGGSVDGLLVLRSMFGPEGCRVARRLCVEYAQALAVAGLDLVAAPRPARQSAPAYSSPGQAVVRR